MTCDHHSYTCDTQRAPQRLDQAIPVGLGSGVHELLHTNGIPRGVHVKEPVAPFRKLLNHGLVPEYVMAQEESVDRAVVPKEVVRSALKICVDDVSSSFVTPCGYSSQCYLFNQWAVCRPFYLAWGKFVIDKYEFFVVDCNPDVCGQPCRIVSNFVSSNFDFYHSISLNDRYNFLNVLSH